MPLHWIQIVGHRWKWFLWMNKPCPGGEIYGIYLSYVVWARIHKFDLFFFCILSSCGRNNLTTYTQFCDPLTANHAWYSTMHLSHIPQYIIIEQKCLHFCSPLVRCGIWDRCIMGLRDWSVVITICLGLYASVPRVALQIFCRSSGLSVLSRPVCMEPSFRYEFQSVTN